MGMAIFGGRKSRFQPHSKLPKNRVLAEFLQNFGEPKCANAPLPVPIFKILKPPQNSPKHGSDQPTTQPKPLTNHAMNPLLDNTTPLSERHATGRSWKHSGGPLFRPPDRSQVPGSPWRLATDPGSPPIPSTAPVLSYTRYSGAQSHCN